MLNQEEYFIDSVRHAEGGTVVTVRSTDQRVACSSPTQRSCYVYGLRLAGARSVFDNSAGGAVGGAGNYVNQSIVNGGFNSGDLWESTWKGAVSGAVGGGAGAWGSGSLASMSGGFAGGVTSSALYGGDGWDVFLREG